MTDSLVPPSTSAPLTSRPPSGSTPARSPRRIVSSNDLPRTPTKEPLDPLSALSDELSSLAALHPPTGRTPQPNGRPANGWETFTSSGFSASPDQRLRHLASTLGRFSRSSSSEGSGVLVDDDPDRPKLDLEFSAKKPLDVDDIFATFPGSHTGRSASDSHATQAAGPSRSQSRDNLTRSGQPQGLQKTAGLSAVVPPPPLPHGKRKSLNLARPSSEHGEPAATGPKSKRERVERTSSAGSRMSLSQSLRDFASQFKRTKSVRGSGGSAVKGGGDGVKRATSTSSKAGLRSGFFTASRSQSKATNLATLAENKSSTEPAVQGETGEPGTARTAGSDMPTEYTTGEFGDFVKISPPSQTILSEETKAEDWVYIGEGGAHMIFSYRGDVPQYRAKALRLKKAKRAVDDDEATERNRIWREECLPRLVPPELLLSQQTVLAEAGWVKRLLSNAEPHRPEARRVDAVDVDREVVEFTLCEDLRSIDSVDGEFALGVEIKPKWGFLPSATSIVPNEAAEIKSQHCRFCLHQHLRGRIINEERYCPLDLYSGVDERMQKAMVGLIKQWKEADGETNNLRLFAGPEVLKPADISSELSALAFIPPMLRASKATSTLRQLQAIMESRDITALAADFAAAHPDAAIFDRALLPEIKSAELGQCVELYQRYSADGAGNITAQLRHRCIMYGLSAIFKDCSIFINVVFKRGPLDGVELVKGRSSVKIIDLDLKPLANLKKWYDTDETIWRHALANPSIPPCRPIDDDLAAPVDTETISDLTPKRKPRTLEAVSTHTSTRAMYAATEEGSIRTDILPTPVGERLSLNDALALSPTKAHGHGDQEVLTDKQDSPSAATFGRDLVIREHDAPVKVVNGDEISVVRSRRSLAPSPSPVFSALPTESTPLKPDGNALDDQKEHQPNIVENVPESTQSSTVPNLEVLSHDRPPSRPATPRRPSSFVFLRPEEDEVANRSETPFEPVNRDDISEMGYDPVSDRTFGDTVPLDMVLDEIEGRAASPSSPLAASALFAPPPALTLPHATIDSAPAPVQDDAMPVHSKGVTAEPKQSLTSPQPIPTSGQAATGTAGESRSAEPIEPQVDEHHGLIEAAVAATASVPILGGVVAAVLAPEPAQHHDEEPTAAETIGHDAEAVSTGGEARTVAEKQESAGEAVHGEPAPDSSTEASAIPDLSAVPALPLPKPISVEFPSEVQIEAGEHDVAPAIEEPTARSMPESLVDTAVELPRTDVEASPVGVSSGPPHAFLETPGETPFATPAETPFDIPSASPLDSAAAGGKLSPASSSASQSTGESYEERVVQQMDDISTAPQVQTTDNASIDQAPAPLTVAQSDIPPTPPSEPRLMRTEPVDLSAADVEAFKPQSEAPVLGDPVHLTASASIEADLSDPADEVAPAAELVDGAPSSKTGDTVADKEVVSRQSEAEDLPLSTSDEIALAKRVDEGLEQHDESDVNVGKGAPSSSLTAEDTETTRTSLPESGTDISLERADKELVSSLAPREETAGGGPSAIEAYAVSPRAEELSSSSGVEKDYTPNLTDTAHSDDSIGAAKAMNEPLDPGTHASAAPLLDSSEIEVQKDAPAPEADEHAADKHVPQPHSDADLPEQLVGADHTSHNERSNENKPLETQSASPAADFHPNGVSISPPAIDAHSLENDAVPQEQANPNAHAVPDEHADSSEIHPSAQAAELGAPVAPAEPDVSTSAVEEKKRVDELDSADENAPVTDTTDLAETAATDRHEASLAIQNHPDEPELDVPGALPVEHLSVSDEAAHDMAHDKVEKDEVATLLATTLASAQRSRTPEQIPLPPTPARRSVSKDDNKDEEDQIEEES